MNIHLSLLSNSGLLVEHRIRWLNSASPKIRQTPTEEIEMNTAINIVKSNPCYGLGLTFGALTLVYAQHIVAAVVIAQPALF